MYKWLDSALDFGLMEHQYWDMSLDELRRWFDSQRRRLERERKERATFDYTLACLIGHAFAATQSRGAHMPEMREAYAELYNTPEERERKAEQEAELFAARFREYAEAHNRRLEQQERGQ